MTTSQPGGIWILDEAIGLLRALPAKAWTIWLLGSLPFTYFLVDFLAEMSRSAFAAERLAGRSFGLAILFVWKWVTQALFSAECLALLRDEPFSPSRRDLLRLTLTQAALQPWRLVVAPLAAVLIVPSQWVFSFFRNVGPAALREERNFIGEAQRIARVNGRGQSLALVVLALGWVLLFANVMVLWFVIPMLLKAFFGIQTEFSRLAFRLMNVITFTITMILTTVMLEPVMNALAAIQTFHAQSRRGGEDLLSVLRRMAAVLCVVAALAGASPMAAQPERPPAAESGTAAAQATAARTVDARALQQRIDNVLHQPEFSWRLPKQQVNEDSSRGWLTRFFNSLGEWLGNLVAFFRKLFGDEASQQQPQQSGFQLSGQTLRWLMIGIAVLAAGAVVMLLLSRRAPVRSNVTPDVAVPVTDLADESISAERHPEEEWLRMAHELVAKGDYRLAMRAVHLAGLRYLGEKGLVALQPAKTGTEYGRELARRRRDDPSALAAYSQGLRQFESVWYGFDGAGAEGFERLCGTWEEVRRHA